MSTSNPRRGHGAPRSAAALCSIEPSWPPACGRLARRLSTLFVLLLSLCASPAFAQWGPEKLDSLAQGFASAMSARFNLTAYPWHFAIGCSKDACLNTNPDTVYAFPDFAGGNGDVIPARMMAANSAFVLIMETPPPMRYYGLTSYIATKYYASLPGKPWLSGTVPVIESLNDATNLATVGTASSPVKGGDPYSQLAVFVMTADARTYRAVVNQLSAQGIPSTAINLVDLPISVQPAVPLNMGTAPNSDTYLPMMRLTYPLDTARYQDYLLRAPVRTFYLQPRSQAVSSPLPPTSYRTPGNGQSEPAELRTARDQLATQLLAQYNAQFPVVSESKVTVVQTINYLHVAFAVPGNADNPDALYVGDIGADGSFAPGLDDRLLVVGVNHSTPNHGTGKATYFSHSLEIVANQAGVLGVSDLTLEGSALKAAGITDANDPRYDTYRKLYVFTMSYSCPPGDTLCVTIPPDDGKGGGVPVGTPIGLMSRVYLDPVTHTRPSKDELIFERVFLMRKAGAANR